MRDNYLTMSPEQLAADQDFLAWQQGGQDDALWQQWLSAHPGQAENVRIAILLVKALATPSETLGAEQRDALWSRIADSTRPAQTVPQPMRRIVLVRWAAAASILLLIALGFWLLPSRTSVSVAAGETRQYTLPESSKVTLNAASEMAFNEKSFTEERTLKLKGEAFFQVRKGSAFTVQTHAGNVRVLGTSFNVRQRNASFDVTCYTGSVEVTSGQDVVILKPNESVELVGGKLNKSSLSTPVTNPGWMAGEFQYDNAELGEVLAELSRQYAIQIDAPAAVQNRRYTGFFTRGDLDTALQSVLWPLHLSYTVSDRRVTVAQ